MEEIKDISLKELLKKKVVIPKIQRDYAQGRVGKEYIRKDFLMDLCKSLRSDSEITFKIDFIYGYEENDTFFPLDGQQRLTTLWLVYWYIVVSSGKMKDYSEILSKFSYDTRTSSREFCKKICTKDMTGYFKNSNSNADDYGIVDYIEDQTWFMKSWKNDPTIDAMLRMIKGTTKEVEIKEEIDGNTVKKVVKRKNLDGIEQVFIEENMSEYDKYLANIEKIKFYVITMDNNQLPINQADKLYVRMNGRGKQLTSFENFKSDFLKMLTCNKDLKEKTEIKIDRVWTKYFWILTRPERDSNHGKIDDIFFTFINRYCENILSIEKEKEKELVDYFLPKRDWEMVYSDIDYYKKVFCDKNEENEYIPNPEKINKINRTFDNLLKMIEDKNSFKQVKEILNKYINNLYDNNTISHLFFQCFRKKSNKSDEIVNRITYNERVYLYSICKYFEEGEYESDSFRQWMRVIRNIIENIDISSDSAMRQCIRTINSFEFSKDKSDDNTNFNAASHNILKYLSDLSEKDISDKSFYDMSKLDAQVYEEVLKAKKIYDKENSKINEDWSSRIAEMEEKAFFRGNIRFLFLDENGKEEKDWENFTKKSEKVKDWKNNKVPVEFVKEYARYFAKVIAGKARDGIKLRDEKIPSVFHQTGRSNRGDSWINTFCNGDWYEVTHNVLLSKSYDEINVDKIFDKNQEELIKRYNDLIGSELFIPLVKSVRNKDNREELLLRTYGYPYQRQVLMKKNAHEGIILDDDYRRSELLIFFYKKDKGTIRIDGEGIDDEGNDDDPSSKKYLWIVDEEKNPVYVWGFDVEFIYKEEVFKWKYDNVIVNSKKDCLNLKDWDENNIPKDIDEYAKEFLEKLDNKFFCK